MIFRDRADAGRQLAAALDGFRDRRPFVLAIPRGGVAVGFEVAAALSAPLDVIVPRKLRAPYNPELAVGAVAHDGSVYLDTDLVRSLHAPQDYIREEIATQLEEIRRRMRLYRGERPTPDLSGYTAIVVDDGIATGATMIAALRAARAMHPTRLVVAVPVAPRGVVDRLQTEADEVYCLYTPEVFYAVGQFYDDFGQTIDDEVIRLLQRRAAALGESFNHKGPADTMP